MAKTRTVAEREIREIPVDCIRADPEQPRKVFEEIKEFSQSLEVNPTIEQPLIVEQTSNQGAGTYTLLDGERRYRAAIKAGFMTVLCDVRHDLSELEREMIRARIHLQRKHWSAKEQIEFFDTFYRRWLKEKYNETLEMSGTKSSRIDDFASLVGISVATMHAMLRVIKSPEAMRQIRQGAPIHGTSYAADPNDGVTQQIIETARKLETTYAPSKKKSTRFRDAPLPDRRTLQRARQIVKAEQKETPEQRDSQAFAAITQWIDGAAVYNASIRMNMKNITRKESMEHIVRSLMRQIQAYNELVVEAENIFPTIRKSAMSKKITSHQEEDEK